MPNPTEVSVNEDKFRAQAYLTADTQDRSGQCQRGISELQDWPCDGIEGGTETCTRTRPVVYSLGPLGCQDASPRLSSVVATRSMEAVKLLVHKVFRTFGYDVFSMQSHRPVLFGSPAILGSFPPARQHSLVGSPENYFIHDGYRHRKEGKHFDDTQFSGEWQLEVYQFAREICDREGLKTVCDIGCGSAYKLLRYFRDLSTVGLDVRETCEYLRKRWPDRHWMESDFVARPPFPIDMVIASDVIEHLTNPNELLLYIQKVEPRYAVLSTPDRNLLRNGTYDGPPHNPSHVREWSFAEFNAYIGHFFEIEAHFISFPAQATQCVLCKPILAP